MLVELDSIREQIMPFECPYCYHDMDMIDVIGEQEYDVVRIGHNIGGIASIFECPKCFEKSFIHKESLKWRIR